MTHSSVLGLTHIIIVFKKNLGVGGHRASVADVAKIMPFYHIKDLLYYFTTSFYNIPFIRCFIIQF